MDPSKKESRYQRVYNQLLPLMQKCSDPGARMATITALLHHKMENFFWTGFYCLKEGTLTVVTYQGPLACQTLESHKGVCWAAIDQEKIQIVDDVHQFPGHIACDSRSNSEIVVPVREPSGAIIGVLDIDSTSFRNFDTTDAIHLEKIVALIHL